MGRIFAKVTFRLMLAAAVSAAMIALLLSLVTDVAPRRLPGVLEALPGISLPLAGLAFALTVGQSLFRSIRYRLLLRQAMAGGVPGHGRMLMVTFARNMLVDALPARIGELGYVALLNLGSRVGVADGLMSLAVSFVFDLAALAVIVLMFLGSGMLAGSGSPAAAPLMALLVVAAAAVWAAVFRGLTVLLPLLRRLGGGRFAPWRRFIGLLERTEKAIGLVRRHGVTARVMGLSLGVRACKYAGMYACFLAVTGGPFPEMAVAEPWRVLTAQLFSEAGSSLPLPTLMGFGSYEAGGTAAWTFFGFNAAEAMLVVLLVHICSQAMDYSLGAVGLVALSFARRPDAPAPRDARDHARLRSSLAALPLAALLLIAAVFAADRCRRLGKLGAARPPAAGTALPGARDPAPIPGLDGLKLRVVWSSNREGQHDLFEMTLPSRAVRRLTSDPHVDTFPAYSPGGRRLAFARSQQPWVSQRNSVPWDVYLLDLGGGGETRLARGGTAPRWRDENTVVFERGGRAVVQIDTASGKESILAEAGRDGIPARARLHSPDIDPRTGELLVTVRGAGRMTAFAGPGRGLRRFAGGCQASWLPDGAGVYWVDKGGRMTNQVWIREGNSAPRPLLDLPPPFSHEYFPKLSADGGWLVLAASASGHEHDTADYEIFLWRRGTPGGEAVRLTFHTGNDSWPDIHIDGPAD